MSATLQNLLNRANSQCELCAQNQDLTAYFVTPHETSDASTHVLVCSTCRGQLDEDVALDDKHWFGLQESIWSQYPAVQALSYRTLVRLNSAGWAQDLLDQAYLEEDVLQWAKAGLPAEADDREPTRDSNGTELHEGDSVTLIKDLDVKGTSFTAKRGTMVKHIRLTDNPEHIEGRVNGMTIVLKTQFLKRA